MIYFDTCALLKLIRSEPETQALTGYIADRPGTRWFTAEIARTELSRTIRRVNHDDQGTVLDAERLRAELDQAGKLCAGLDLMPVSSRLLADAAALPQPMMRTLDAIHIAAATALQRSLTAFVTYDKRLAAAAKELRLPVIAPG